MIHCHVWHRCLPEEMISISCIRVSTTAHILGCSDFHYTYQGYLSSNLCIGIDEIDYQIHVQNLSNDKMIQYKQR